MNQARNRSFPDKPSVPVARRIVDGREQIAMVPFEPGMIIERCGKKYQLDKNGTQRRLK